MNNKLHLRLLFCILIENKETSKIYYYEKKGNR